MASIGQNSRSKKSSYTVGYSWELEDCQNDKGAPENSDSDKDDNYEGHIYATDDHNDDNTADNTADDTDDNTDEDTKESKPEHPGTDVSMNWAV